MRNKKRLVLSVGVIIVLASISRGQGWRGISPLHSTREDVVRLLGPPTEPNGITHNLKTERVTVYYSDLGCASGWPYGWNVPAGVVIKILVYPQTKITLPELNIDLKKLTESANVRLGGADYTNEEDGISIGIKTDGYVEVVQYEPAAKDRHLLCPDAAIRKQEIEAGRSTYLRPISKYFDALPSERIGQLKTFAEQLKKYSTKAKVYIISYASGDECRNEALTHGKGVKNYLEHTFGVNAQRFVIVDGGHRSSAEIELYIVEANTPIPLSSPDLHPDSVRINCSRVNKLRRAKGEKRGRLVMAERF